MDIHFRPPDVDVVAQTIATAVVTATRDVVDKLAPSSVAAVANPAWQSSRALTDCANAWRNHLVDLVGRTKDAAQRLSESAAQYRQVELRIEASLLDIRNPRP